MYCRNCGERILDEQEFCHKCGIKAGDGNNFCPKCKKRSTPADKFCGGCGISLLNTPKIVKIPFAGTDKLMILLLCFFFGGIGIHNFVMGENKKGLIKILATILGCGIVGYIFAIIDLVKIIMNTYDVNPASYI